MIKIIRNIFTVLFLTSILIISACAPSAPKKNRYTVTFKDYDGTVLKNEIVEESKNATAPQDPIRYGYIFIGWDNSFENVTENKTITAQYEKDINVSFEYTVIFKDYDGTVLKEEKVIEGKNATPPTTPSKVGYNFIGWDKEYENIQNDLEIYATYETIKYNISYELNGGSMINENPLTYSIEDNFILKNPLKEGCTFGGWYNNPEFSGNKIEKIQKGTTGNIELYAKYNPINYYITYILDGGTNNELNPNGYSAAEEVKLEAPTKEGYKFIGWEHNGVIIESIPQGTKGNIELVAKWEINKYTITFDTDGGTSISSIKQDYNTTIVKPSDPIKEGYIFVGWDQEIPSKMPAENITIKAMWAAIQYTITFDTDGGTSISSITQDYNTTIVKPVNPTKTGYTFVGWDKEVPATMPSQNITINAQWQINQYTITFNSNGGSEVEDIEFTIETNNIELPTPIRDEYHFIGWYENDVLVTEFELRDYNLAAKWEEIKEEIDVEVYEENDQLYVNLGRYPQTVVTDETVINALSTIEITNEFGYIEYNGNEYKKVVADPYNSNYIFITGNAIVEGNTYYFLVEPIKWRVLEESDGTYKLLSKMIIDNTNFYHTYNQNRTINGKTIYPNNYEYSNIRAWLNGYNGTSYDVEDYTNKGFYDIAFTEEEKLLINTTLVDNSLSSTGDSSNSYICNNTNDKVYLLSYKDMINTNYGFSSSYSEYDVSRRVQVSDYVRSKYCWMSMETDYYGNGIWWLLSPDHYDSNYTRVVNSYGYVNDRSVYHPYYGVRPALTITLDKDDYSKVEFKDYDGNLIKIDYVKKGENAIAPTPIREHYNFVGWDKEYTNVQNDLEVKALYEAITYTISFNENGGSEVEDIKFTIETNNIELPTPIRDEYDFIGWYENDVLVTEFELRDYNLVAKWEEIKEEKEIEVYEENGYKYINLGKYPQTVVADENIINALSSMSTTNELGYIEYNGNEYKRVVANLYGYLLGNRYNFINGTEIKNSQIYYFLVEPIKWRVLEENDGTYKLLSELIIDSTENFNTIQFYDSIRIINGQNIYSNNYKYSNIRAWLNGYDATSYGYDNYANNSFLDIAFTEYEKSKINNTLVDNSITSTGSNQNIYVCDNTLDKIYLLSINDVLNNKYGFNASYWAFDSARVTLSSDYARSKYLSISTSVDNYGSGSWILRSPYDNNQNSTNIVSNSGYVGSSFISESDGIRPALTLSLKDKTEYEVIFKDNNDNPLKIENVELGQSATPPENTSSLGYEFIGWDKDYFNIQSDLVVTGIYKPIIYTITFDTDGGDSIENIEFTVESDDLTLPIPIKEKHYFLGWYYEDKLITKTEYQNYNLVAKWELIEENINIEIFEENGIKYTYLGRYPQTVVSDEAIINELSQIVEENEFGYIEYKGNEYKKVTGKPYTNDITFSNGNTIIKNNIYYFLVEPIKWRVNDETEGEYKLLSDIIIDDISYYNTLYNRIVYNQTIYPNNYRYSNIRAWLNGYNGNYYNVEDYTNKGFINVAFTKSEQLIIKNTFVDNELGLSKYWSENTNDKIYLLTNKDLYNTKYGFSSSIGYSSSRAGRLSDYAKCLGSVVSSNYGYWWLREPSSSLNYESMAKCVFNYGYATESFVSSSYGVRPAMIITIK